LVFFIFIQNTIHFDNRFCSEGQTAFFEELLYG
jgi:hypothetical protein